jgi:hypothetical protein
MKLNSLLIVNALVFAPAAFADGDSSSDAAAGFVQNLDASEGLMVVVPINDKDEELVSAAETRIVKEGFSIEGDFATAFNAAEPVDTDAAVTDVDVNSDSATSGWYYGNTTYRNHRYYRSTNVWCPTYYYRTYTPSYYHRGYRYSYHRPVYRTYPGRGQHHGYRYYYYGRGW